MRRGSLVQHFETLVAAALIAAHAQSAREHFRQRDVKFLIELFSNWLEFELEGSALSVQTTQIARYLDQLLTDGFLKKETAETAPRYRLTRPGLLELLVRLTKPNGKIEPSAFYFRYYFLRCYKQRIVELVQAEGARFPPSLRVELDALLDEGELLREQLAIAERALLKIRSRIRDSLDGGQRARRMFLQGATTADVARDLETHHPYELNSQKPLSELLGSLPPHLARFEMEEASLARAELLWRPIEQMLEAFISSLRRLQ
ncbi:MAG: hypothetical protein KDD69_11445 [Bdellovibrionales bacterium]|nr:hypothetical protein [Bdellovibrionales bacterium]